MALMVESGFPGRRAVAMAWLSRSTAARSAAESSVIVRETSVAVSMARSAMPGWIVDSGVSISTIPYPRSYEAGSMPVNEAATFGYPRERSFRTAGLRDLWLSATGAVLNGGWRPRIKKCGSKNFVPSGSALVSKIGRKPRIIIRRRAESLFSVFCERFAGII